MEEQFRKRLIPRMIYFCFISSLVISILRLYDIINIQWPILLIPLYFGIFLLIPQTLYSLAENKEMMQVLSYSLILFSVYACVISSIGFAVLAGLKFEETISSSWYYVFFPAWDFVFSFVCFAFLMFPGLVHPNINMKREAFSLIAIAVTMICTSVMLVMWLEGDMEDLWPAMIPIEMSLFGSLVVCVRTKFQSKKRYLPMFDPEARMYLAVLPICVFGSIREAESSAMPIFLILLSPLMYFVFLWASQDIPCIKKANESQEETVELIPRCEDS